MTFFETYKLKLKTGKPLEIKIAYLLNFCVLFTIAISYFDYLRLNRFSETQQYFQLWNKYMTHHRTVDSVWSSISNSSQKSKAYHSAIENIYRTVEPIKKVYFESNDGSFRDVYSFDDRKISSIRSALIVLAKESPWNFLSSADTRSKIAVMPILEKFFTLGNFSQIYLDNGQTSPMTTTYLRGLSNLLVHTNNGYRTSQEVELARHTWNRFWYVIEAIDWDKLGKKSLSQFLEAIEANRSNRSVFEYSSQFENFQAQRFVKHIKSLFPLGYAISSLIHGNPLDQLEDFYNNPASYETLLETRNPLIKSMVRDISKTNVAASFYIHNENQVLRKLKQRESQ